MAAENYDQVKTHIKNDSKWQGWHAKREVNPLDIDTDGAIELEIRGIALSISASASFLLSLGLRVNVTTGLLRGSAFAGVNVAIAEGALRVKNVYCETKGGLNNIFLSAGDFNSSTLRACPAECKTRLAKVQGAWSKARSVATRQDLEASANRITTSAEVTLAAAMQDVNAQRKEVAGSVRELNSVSSSCRIASEEICTSLKQMSTTLVKTGGTVDETAASRKVTAASLVTLTASAQHM